MIYTLLILPISIARFASFAGVRVPNAITFLADMIFALGGWFVPPSICIPPHIITPAPHLTADVLPSLGFANFIHFLRTRRYIPDVSTIPDLSTPRERLHKGSSRVNGITPSSRVNGITPFILTSCDTEERQDTIAAASDGEVTPSWSEMMSSEMLVPNRT